MYSGNKSAKNHDGFFRNSGQHVIVVTFKASKRSWVTTEQNQNSIMELLYLFLDEFCMIFSFLRYCCDVPNVEMIEKACCVLERRVQKIMLDFSEMVVSTLLL